ncbi:hypothetical protein [Fibrella aquatica]|uniref:hypothetical protein n=1 Tax=Fibrella aquatica TaxID=3242487 RepID=UPI0035200131
MNKLTKYKSIQELKASTKPIDTTSAKSKERHEKFERFINLLKDDTISDTTKVVERL